VLTELPSGNVYVAPEQIEAEVELDVFARTVNVVVIALSQPAAFGMCETYTPAVLTELPSGSEYDAPEQIDALVELDVFARTVSVVVTALSQPAAFGI
jgi:hypothetical protein